MDVPYRAIAQELAQGRVIPFLGAAASYAGVPEGPTRLPDGRGLAKEFIAAFKGYPGEAQDPLTKIAQFYEECVLGRSPVYHFVRERFYERQSHADIGATAQLLADQDQCKYIITTNYDHQIESALTANGREFVVLTHVTNPRHSGFGQILVIDSVSRERTLVVPKELVLSDFGEKTLVYKVHGTFDEGLTEHEDTLILTEDDYVKFVNMSYSSSLPPAALIRLFQKHHLLYLGYSLEDWNFRVILRRLQEAAGPGPSYMSWAVQWRIPEIDKRFWAKRNVELYDVELSVFIARLASELAYLPTGVDGR